MRNVKWFPFYSTSRIKFSKIYPLGAFNSIYDGIKRIVLIKYQFLLRASNLASKSASASLTPPAATGCFAPAA